MTPRLYFNLNIVEHYRLFNNIYYSMHYYIYYYTYALCLSITHNMCIKPDVFRHWWDRFINRLGFTPHSYWLQHSADVYWLQSLACFIYKCAGFAIYILIFIHVDIYNEILMLLFRHAATVSRHIVKEFRITIICSTKKYSRCYFINIFLSTFLYLTNFCVSLHALTIVRFMP